MLWGGVQEPPVERSQSPAPDCRPPLPGQACPKAPRPLDKPRDAPSLLAPCPSPGWQTLQCLGGLDVWAGLLRLWGGLSHAGLGGGLRGPSLLLLSLDCGVLRLSVHCKDRDSTVPSSTPSPQWRRCPRRLWRLLNHNSQQPQPEHNIWSSSPPECNCQQGLLDRHLPSAQANLPCSGCPPGLCPAAEAGSSGSGCVPGCPRSAWGLPLLTWGLWEGEKLEITTDSPSPSRPVHK